jgi:uncharacterized GH25 family protein
MFIRLLPCLTVAFLTTAHLSAHDFWLALSNWAPPSGTSVTITAGVGERFPTRTEFKSRPDWFDQWRVIGVSGDIPVTNDFQRADLTMATDVTLPARGAYLGVMRVTPRTIEMNAQEFNDYLKEEGLEHILAVRQASGEADKPATERYSRYAKVAFRNGGGSALHLTRPVGLNAEFVPATDPTAVHAGGSLTVRLLRDGKPVGAAAVTAVSEGSSIKGQTDADGSITLKIDREGAWLVKTVHMVRLSKAESAEADWESYWVTLSFHTARH